MGFLELFLLIFKVLGGLAIFIFGMNIMTEGLKMSIGAKLQRLLSKTTRNKYSGFALGNALGLTIHSSATTVMLVGFVNAGLMTLEQSIAPMLGSNVGTTISMQAVSLNINEYAFVAVTAGLVISLISSTTKGKYLGRSILGFGLLFIGMDFMSGAIAPHRDALAVAFESVHADTFTSLIIGVALSAILTGIWQSSGATIAIVFAMLNAEVFTSFSQVYPIVLGAHMGTCVTSLLGSIGANIEARRASISHLLFNVFNVGLAIIAKPFFFWLIPLTAPGTAPENLIRQTANLHTAVMLIAAVIILPFAFSFAKFVRYVARSKKPMPESSYLDYDCLEYPERGIVAMLLELQRVSRVCSQSLYLMAHVVLRKHERSTVGKIKTNEQVIDDIKLATREYISTMTKKYLSRRQIIMSHHLNRCMTDIERIGDHIDELCDLSLSQSLSTLDKETMDSLFALYEKSKNILELVIKSLDPEQENFQESAMSILKAREEYIECSIEANERFMKKVENHEISSSAALYFREYISIMDRMNRHIKSIALAQKHEDFWIKRSKLDKKTKSLDTLKKYNYNIDSLDYIDKLQSEDY